MTDRHLATLLAFSFLALTACGDPPAVPDASIPDDGAIPDAGSSCAGGTTTCGDECVDTASSRANCGACGNACATGEACVEGDCTIVCPSGQSACDDLCADTETDRRHCGACGTACDAGELCVAGSCEVSCPTGQTVCGSSCVDNASDPAHCGACGTACDAGEVCSAGVCATRCGGGATDCGGACVDTATSPAHCGGCDVACTAPTGASGLCVAGACRAVCDALTADCNADRGDASGDGCETPLATDPSNCGACGRVCALADAVAGCDAGGCVVAACDTGYGDCDADDANGCEVVLATDAANCGTCGVACAAGSACFGGACVVEAGEDCSDAIVLTPGPNNVTWSATSADYLTASPSCSTTALAGPDVVMSYTAATDQRVTIGIDKPAGTRWSAVASTGACGALLPESACMSDAANDRMFGSFLMTAGQTAYVYARDTTVGALPLGNPLSVEVTTVECTAAPTAVLDPPNGGTISAISPTFVARFGAPMVEAGTITIAGDMGTSLTYDVAISDEVTLDTTSTILTIEPAVALPPGEVLTVTWTGLESFVCTTAIPVPSPTWQVTVPVPPCTPGVGGVVGTTLTRTPTGLGTITEYFVVADDSPTGYVYFGGTSYLYRMPKGGLPEDVEDIEALAALETEHLGYALVIDGLNIFTIESRTTGTTQHVFRISDDGGATWMKQPYATFPMEPGDDFRGAMVYGGRIYLVTDESTDGVPTEIWSVESDAVRAPVAATLERTFLEQDCSGIARDTTHYYVTCGTGDRLVRLPVAASGGLELVTDEFDLNITVNAVHGNDLDADGVFDVLYVSGAHQGAGFVCDPAGASPFAGSLFSFGTGTSDYGLGFDRVANVLWTIDDDNRDLISVQ